jgi:hypothetical protein
MPKRDLAPADIEVRMVAIANNLDASVPAKLFGVPALPPGMLNAAFLRLFAELQLRVEELEKSDAKAVKS